MSNPEEETTPHGDERSEKLGLPASRHTKEAVSQAVKDITMRPDIGEKGISKANSHEFITRFSAPDGRVVSVSEVINPQDEALGMIMVRTPVGSEWLVSMYHIVKAPDEIIFEKKVGGEEDWGEGKDEEWVESFQDQRELGLTQVDQAEAEELLSLLSDPLKSPHKPAVKRHKTEAWIKKIEREEL